LTSSSSYKLRPLWTTSFLLQDYLTHHSFFNADAVVISSATSKTSFCLAHLLTRLPLPPSSATTQATSDKAIKVIGLTSARNLQFAKSLGVYTDLVLYEDVTSLNKITNDSKMKMVYVDIAGDSKLLKSLMNIFGEETYMHGCLVGMSHQNQPSLTTPSTPSQIPQQQLQQPKWTVERNQMFFAPAWAKQRVKDLGPREYSKRMQKGWMLLLQDAPKWVHFKQVRGKHEFEGEYRRLFDGKVGAEEGLIASLVDNSGGRAIAKV
jgi:hypothetical protein